MGLSDRLAETTPNKSNRGCRTCQWLLTLGESDLAAFHNWIADGNSVMQLHKVCNSDPDNPLPVSFTALRNHVRDCM